MSHRSIYSSFIISVICSLFSQGQSLIIDSLPYNNTYKKVRIFKSVSSEPYVNQKLPILFMLDGQNLFDDTTSFSGEWEVDESIIKLTSSLKPVVIGIDHGGSERINELTPYPHDKYGGGDAYLLLEWITNQLMPFIRSKYGLQINPEHCAIAGSSLGGLFSHYAILKRPDLFRYAGVFSPSYWYNKDVYQETNSQIATAKRFMYLSAGDNEDETMIPNLKKMVDILNKHPNISLETKTIVDGEHNEKQWKTSFPEFLNWWIYNLSD